MTPSIALNADSIHQKQPPPIIISSISFDLGVKLMDKELTQYLKPLAVGPSSNRCPK
jgi:hypothetical protein